MTYTARSRDRFKALAATTTGVIVFGATAATGAAAGLAARATAIENPPVAESASVQQPPQHVSPIKRERPERTVIHTRIITRTTAPGAVQPATGSTVSVPNQPAASAPQGAANPPAKPAPQPAPQPAPSSGS